MTAGPRKRTNGRRRQKGTGSTYWVASRKRWAAAFVLTAQDGTKRKKVVYGRTEDEARELLDEARRKAKTEAAATTRPSGTVEAYLGGWLARHQRQVRGSTWLSRRGHVTTWIVPILGAKRLDRLTPTDVEAMTDAIVRSGRSPRTAAHVRVTLRVALRDAVRDGLVARNVAALARPPRVEHVERDILDADQTRLLLDSTRDDRLGPLWAILAGSGLRLGEALGLAWDDLDLDEGTVTVRRSWAKTGERTWGVSVPKTQRSRRVVPLPPRVVAALRDLRSHQDLERVAAGDRWQRYPEGQPVFTDEYGRRPDPTRINAAFRRSLGEAELPTTRIHDLRHGYATRLLEEDVPLVTVSRLLGHSTIAITGTVYAHVGEGLKREAADAMARVLGDA